MGALATASFGGIPMAMNDPIIQTDPASAHPDAELISLCDGYVHASLLKEQTWKKWEMADAPERHARAIHFPRWLPRQEIDPLHRSAERISTIPALTQDGVRAKARVVRCWLQHTYGGCTADHRPQFSNDAEMAAAWSLVEDLLENAPTGR